MKNMNFKELKEMISSSEDSYLIKEIIDINKRLDEIEKHINCIQKNAITIILNK